jgi:AcrR family transcriptional regulator
MDPRQERSRTAALQAATELMATEGWEAVTPSRVAERAGLGRTTIYRHWPDPTRLLHDVISQEATTGHIAPSGDLRDDLIGELDVIRYDLIDLRLAPVLATIIDRAERNPAFQEMKVALVKEASAMLRQILHAGVISGQLPAGLNVERAIASLMGAIVYRQMLTGDSVTHRFIQGLVDDFLAGHCNNG